MELAQSLHNRWYRKVPRFNYSHIMKYLSHLYDVRQDVLALRDRNNWLAYIPRDILGIVCDYICPPHVCEMMQPRLYAYGSGPHYVAPSSAPLVIGTNARTNITHHYYDRGIEIARFCMSSSSELVNPDEHVVAPYAARLSEFKHGGSDTTSYYIGYTEIKSSYEDYVKTDLTRDEWELQWRRCRDTDPWPLSLRYTGPR